YCVGRDTIGERAATMQQNKERSDDTSLSLLERARRRDPGAWERLMALYRPLVLFWCSRAGLYGPDAEAVSQEVFAAAAVGLPRFHRDQPGDTFRGWLRGITRNHVLLFRRRNSHQARAEGGSTVLQHLQEIPDPLGAADADEQTQITALYHRAL